jgi:ABC-type oligopeptide transport system ATPase subunit
VDAVDDVTYDVPGGEVLAHVVKATGKTTLGRVLVRRRKSGTEVTNDRNSNRSVMALLSSIPVPDPSAADAVVRLEGTGPSARRPSSGCRFHTRCQSELGRIYEEVEPPWQPAGGDELARVPHPAGGPAAREPPVRPARASNA